MDCVSAELFLLLTWIFHQDQRISRRAVDQSAKGTVMNWLAAFLGKLDDKNLAKSWNSLVFSEI